jgi:hypothetical protein
MIDNKFTATLPFTDNQIIELASRLHPSELWKRAFIYHNNSQGNPKYSLGCQPCYMKVLCYILKVRLSNTVSCYQPSEND